MVVGVLAEAADPPDGSLSDAFIALEPGEACLRGSIIGNQFNEIK